MSARSHLRCRYCGDVRCKQIKTEWQKACADFLGYDGHRQLTHESFRRAALTKIEAHAVPDDVCQLMEGT